MVTGALLASSDLHLRDFLTWKQCLCSSWFSVDFPSINSSTCILKLCRYSVSVSILSCGRVAQLSYATVKPLFCLLFVLTLPSASSIWFCWALVWEEAVNSHNASHDFFSVCYTSPSAVSFFMLIGCSLFSYSGAELNSGTVILCSCIIISALFLLFTITKHWVFFIKLSVMTTECFLNGHCGCSNLFFICILFHTFLQWVFFPVCSAVA